MKKKFLISLILMLMLLCNIKVYAAEDLPSKYDLRSDISIEVENQGTFDWCGQYAEIKMIETYIQKNKGITYDLSEAYMAHYRDFNGTYGKHVLESDFPTKEYTVTESNQKKFDNATSKAVVENFEYKRNVAKDKNAIKEYIMNYGGVFTTTMDDNQFHNYTGAIYRSGESSKDIMSHSVLIIGWDDNYSKNNFKNEKPENDGAWLILNSWGTSWGNKGTAWVSYEDYYDVVKSATAIQNLTLSSGEVIETKLSKDEVKQEDVEGTKMTIAEDTKNNDTEGILTNSDFFTMFIQIFIILLVLTGIICLVIKIKNKKKTD